MDSGLFQVVGGLQHALFYVENDSTIMCCDAEFFRGSFQYPAKIEYDDNTKVLTFKSSTSIVYPEVIHIDSFTNDRVWATADPASIPFTPEDYEDKVDHARYVFYKENKELCDSVFKK